MGQQGLAVVTVRLFCSFVKPVDEHVGASLVPSSTLVLTTIVVPELGVMMANRLDRQLWSI